MNKYIPYFLACALLWSGRPCAAQTTPAAAPPDIPALIRQLGDEKVRLRDEAEAKLRLLPEAAAALDEAAESHPSDEARIRARKILNSAIRNRWYLAASLGNGHLPGYAWGVIRIRVAPDNKSILTQGQDGACLWNAADFNVRHQIGKPNGIISGWEGAAPLRCTALSPDGKTAITGDDFGILYATDTASGKLRQSWRNFDVEFHPTMPNKIQTVWSALYTPDGRYLSTSGWAGYLVVRDARTFKRVAALKLGENVLVDQFASPDSRWLLAVEDTPGSVDYLHVVDTTTWREADRRPIRDLISALEFFADGKRFVGAGREGQIAIWDFDPESGQIGEEDEWGTYAGKIQGMILSHDQKSIIVGSNTAGKQLCEYDLTTKKILWSDITTHQINHIAAFGPDGFITSGWDYQLRVWRRTPAGAASPPPTLVRTMTDRFDPADSYLPKYEAEPHAARPCLIDALVYLPKSELLVTRGHDRIVVSSAEDLATVRSFGPKVTVLPGHLSRTTCGTLAVTADEQTVIAADDNGVIGFYDIGTGKLARSFPTLDPDVARMLPAGVRSTLEIVPDRDEKILYTTDSQSRLCAWDMATGKALANTNLPAPGAMMQLSPDGKYLVIRTLDSRYQCLQLLVATNGLKLLAQTPDNGDACYWPGVFVDEGRGFLRPENDGQLRRIGIGSEGLGKPEVVLRLPKPIYDAAATDDGSRLVCAAAAPMALSLWDLNTKRLLWMADSSTAGLFRALPLGTDRIVTVGLEDNKLRLYVCGKRKTAREVEQ